MFKAVDPTRKITKDEYKATVPDLKTKLGELQRRIHETGLPVIIAIEGWDAASMASIVNQLLLPLDPRGFSYHNIVEPDRVEKMMPFMWRFWMRTPYRGRMAIFDRSWYSRAVAECLEEGKCKALPQDMIDEINRFEKLLADDGAVIIKLFLHTSNVDQRRPRRKLNDQGACGLIEEDLDVVKHYRKNLPLLEEIMERTDTLHAPWTIVEADDPAFAEVKVIRKVTDRLERALSAGTVQGKGLLQATSGRSIRASLDLDLKVDDDEYKEKLSKYQAKLRGIQCELYRKKKRLIVVFEGRDASGKGGNIKRLTQTLNPRTYEVIGTAAPSDLELSQHYLWRFHRRLPRPGHIAIFDRSWYGRVLVERVNDLAREDQWRRAYHEINDFERMLVDNQASVVKLWLEVDKKTQLQRFIERVEDPCKVWKISKDDWDAREKWGRYSEAIDEMLLRTSTSYAPWTIVESNDKNHSRLKTLKTIIEAAEKAL